MRKLYSMMLIAAAAAVTCPGCGREPEATGKPMALPMDDSTAVRILRDAAPHARVKGWVEQGCGETLRLDWSARDTLLPWGELGVEN